MDGAVLCELADRADRERLERLPAAPAAVLPGGRQRALLFHLESPREALARLPVAGWRELGEPALAVALLTGDDGLDRLCRAWGGVFRARAAAVGHRFDLHADYLATAREFVLVGLRAAALALPTPAGDGALERFLERLAASLRAGATRHADREVYRLTKQMVREGVLTWRDERGRVVEHPALRQSTDDPGPLVSERALRQDLNRFVRRHGPRLLGARVWERFRLHFLEGWTQGAIARHQGVTQQAVSESLAAAAERLRVAFSASRPQGDSPRAGTSIAASARRC